VTKRRQGIASYFARVSAALHRLDVAALDTAVDMLLTAHARGGTVFICGNGGSAATASHMAADLAKGAPVGRVTGLRAFALTDNVPTLTAWANDTDYAEVFGEQVRNLVRPGDVLIAISASGNSPNVLRAVEQAHLQGAATIGLCGFGGGRLAQLANHVVLVDSMEYGPVEDVHLILNHAIAEAVRAAITPVMLANRLQGAHP
jgi:D-sedoheptulose 7-phosphate isomerase